LAAVFLISILIFSAPLSVILDYAKNPEFLRWFAMIAFLDAICVIPFAWLRFHNMPIKYSVIRVASILVQTISVIALLFLYQQVLPKNRFRRTSFLSFH
jgi:hypothetical protein